MRSGVDSVAGSAGGVIEAEAERAVDGVLAGPLPEALARSLVEHRVVERIVSEMLASGELQRVVASATADERTERLVQQVLTSPALEQLLGSPELHRVIENAVRDGLARQTASLADSMAASARRLDGAIEAPPRRWLRRPPRPQAVPDADPAVPYAGLGSRAAALVVDAAAVHAVFLIGCAMYLLVVGLIGRDPSRGLAEALAGIGWTVTVATYFVTFWTAAGQTPGMRLMRLRVLGPAGAPPRLGRSLLRLVASDVAIALVFVGFLPVLVDDRRRALQDFVAGTVVVYEHTAPPGPEPSNLRTTPLTEQNAPAG